MVSHPYYRVSPLLSGRELRLPMDAEQDTIVVRLVLQHAETGEPMEDVDQAVDDCATLMELLFHERYAKTHARKVVVLVDGCLIQNVLLPLLQDFYYKPRVCFNGKRVTRVSICSLQDRGYIVFKCVTREVMENDTRLWVPYVKAQHQFFKQLLDYSSTLNSVTMGILRANVRGGLFAWTSLAHRRACDQQDVSVHSVDVNRLYPSCLMAPALPVVTCYDQFQTIDSLEQYETLVQEHDLVLANFYGTTSIYCDRGSALCFRQNLDRFLQRDLVQLMEPGSEEDIPRTTYADGQTFVVPVAVLKTHLIPSTIPGCIKSVWEDPGLTRTLRKLVLNVNIGKMGIAINERPRETMCFTTEEEANLYQQKYHNDCSTVPVSPSLFICQRQSESTLKLQGGYLLHLWVLDHARWRMQEAYDRLVENGVDVMYCCCDELYFPSDQADRVEFLLPPVGVNEDSYDAFGTFKIGHRDELISSLRTRHWAVGEGTTYLEPQKRSAEFDIMCHLHQDTYVREIAPQPSEENIQNLSLFSRLLLKASVPGAGKSHAVLSRFAAQTVVVCPTNALCIEFTKKYPGVIAMTLHKFLRISAVATNHQTFEFMERRNGETQDAFTQLVHETSTMFDTAGSLRTLDDALGKESENPEAGKILLLDEIFMYSLDLLVRLYYRLQVTRATAIYATGDINQLPPVNEKYEWMKEQRLSAINQLFPFQMELTKCKRMTLEADNRQMESLCKAFLEAPDVRSLKLIIRMAFRDMPRARAIEALSRQNDDFIAVCYYNQTCHDLATSALTTKLQSGVHLVNRRRLNLKGRVMQVNFEFEVLHVGDRHVKLKSLFNEDGHDVFENVPKNHVINHMHWVKTRTCHSLQGSSLSGKLLLFDLSSPHVTKEFLYVALTRARDLSEVYIVPDRVERRR